MASSTPLRLSPGIWLYEAGRPGPALEAHQLAFAQVPSAAFGDGSHPTTRLCAGAVDLHCRLNRPARVLDVGTGTGILARIARARGARVVVGTDIDAKAQAAALANCALDRHPTEIIVADETYDFGRERFDFVIANILEGPLRGLAPSLAAALTPGGRLMLSGFTPLQIPSLRIAYESQGVQFEQESMLENWALLVFHKSSTSLK